MTKNKKKLWLAVCILLLFTISVGMFAGCNQGKKKYDVAIRIGCSDGNVYEFPVGMDELHIKIPYDGIERKYGVKAYNLPNHPRWSKEWFSPSGEGANVFKKTMSYCPPDGFNKGFNGPIKDIGEYHICFEASQTSDLWNYRSVHLYILVMEKNIL